MVTVKLFGLFRLDTGLKEITADVSDVKSLYPILLKEAKRHNPKTKVKAADIDGCIVLVNGKQMTKRAKLQDGDEVMLMSPVCGG
ncbi:MAG: MoaD/ThiS family protein [Lachnospiraceae bacterium]|nr:MoaD/ThiS family protein [Lachnospiraceae bacterium]MBQ6353886.1 MoaD/ThiS family protein [Lachnospiraceae bacterium]